MSKEPVAPFAARGAMMATIRKFCIPILVLAVFTAYFGVGLSCHFKWSADRKMHKAILRERGEFVEPWSPGVVGLVFNVINWPIYAMANIYHYGTPFPAPGTRFPTPGAHEDRPGAKEDDHRERDSRKTYD